MLDKIKWETREEWLELRKHYIGGSDAGAVMGMSPYKGQYALWAEKTGRKSGFSGSIVTDTGAYLEAFVAQLFTKETGKKVRRDNHMMVNSDYPWACADVDRRIVGENALLECKTTTSLPNVRLFNKGEYPETWYCQMTHYLAVTGCERCYLAVLINCREFKIYTLERDEAEIAALMEAEKNFWDLVENDVPPEIQMVDSELLEFAYPADQTIPDQMDLSGDTELLKAYDEAYKAVKEAEALRDELKLRICDLMGQHEVGKCKEYQVKWTPSTRSTFDRKAFEAARPDVDLSPYFKESTSRTFSFKRITK